MYGLLVLTEALSTNFRKDDSIWRLAAVGALSVRLPPQDSVPRKFVLVAKDEAIPLRDRYMRSASSWVILLSFVVLKFVTSNTGVYSDGG